MAVSSGKYNVMLVAGHDLYPPKLESSQSWHDPMCTTMKCSYSRLSYNTNDGDSTAWHQYSGTGVTLTADMKSRMASKGDNPTKLGQWTWVRNQKRNHQNFTTNIDSAQFYHPSQYTN